MRIQNGLFQDMPFSFFFLSFLPFLTYSISFPIFPYAMFTICPICIQVFNPMKTNRTDHAIEPLDEALHNQVTSTRGLRWGPWSYHQAFEGFAVVPTEKEAVSNVQFGPGPIHRENDLQWSCVQGHS